MDDPLSGRAMPVHQMERTPHLEGPTALGAYETFFSLRRVVFAGVHQHPRMRNFQAQSDLRRFHNPNLV